MAQACTFGSVKLIMVTFTSIVMALGAALLAISIFLYVNDDSVYLAEEDVSGFESGIVIFICMGAGAAMIVVALIGLVGALSKSTGILYLFLLILFLTLGLEIAAGIVGFIWRDDVQDDLPSEMGNALQQYNRDQDIKKAWDKIHDKYDCCGRMGRDDWTAIGQSIPASCDTHGAGCYYDVEKNLKRTLEMGSAALIAFALFQMLVMCFTGLMLIKLHRGEGKHLSRK